MVKSTLESSSLYNAATDQVELCVSFIISNENDEPMSQEKRQIFIETTVDTAIPTRPPMAATIPAGDDCSNDAIDMETLPYTGSGTTQGATADFDVENCGADADANGVWYTYTPTEDIVLRASVDGSEQLLRLYSGDAGCENLVCVGTIDDRQDFFAKGGQQYYFLVSKQSFDNVGGSFTIEVKEYTAPANDDCDDAVSIGSLPFVEVGTTEGSSPDFDVESGGADADANGVWYSYTPTEDGSYTASMDPDDSQEIRVYTGGCSALASLGDDISATQTFSGVAGEQYLMLISNKSFKKGSEFTFSMQKDGEVVIDPPANDDCEDAVTVGSLPFTEEGTTEGSTSDFTTESGGADADANGVWFSYTPTDDGVYTASMDPDDTQEIRVYTGGCSALASLGSISATQTFSGVAGERYLMLISEKSASDGSKFILSMRQDGGDGGPDTPIPTFFPTISPTIPGPVPVDPLPPPTPPPVVDATPQPTPKPVVALEPTFEPTVTPTEERPFVICQVCTGGLTVPESTLVGQGGKTCGDLLVDRNNVEEGTAECTNIKNAEATCCPIISPRPTPPPQVVTPPPYAWGGVVPSPPSSSDDGWGSVDTGHNDDGWGIHHWDCSSKSSKSKGSKMFHWGSWGADGKWRSNDGSWGQGGLPPQSSSSSWSSWSKSSKSKSCKAWGGAKAHKWSSGDWASKSAKWNKGGSWNIQGKTDKEDSWSGAQGKAHKGGWGSGGSWHGWGIANNGPKADWFADPEPNFASALYRVHTLPDHIGVTNGVKPHAIDGGGIAYGIAALTLVSVASVLFIMKKWNEIGIIEDDQVDEEDMGVEVIVDSEGQAVVDKEEQSEENWLINGI